MFADNAVNGDVSSQTPQAPAPNTATPTTPAVTPQAAPTVDPSTEPFLRAGETVYKSKEDAAVGMSQKDTLIAQLRDYAIQQTGVDPITGRQVARPQYQGQSQGQPQQPVSYLQNGAQYFADLKKAVDSGDQNGYARIQQQYFAEVAQQQFGMYGPVLQGTIVNNALAAVSREIPEFGQFRSSEAYKATLNRTPTLLNAIQQAEQNPAMADSLADLYRMTWQLNNADVLSKAFKAQQTNAANPQNAARPTAAPTHATPGPQVPQVPQNFRTDDAARKALIQQFESSGRDGKI